MDFVSRVAGEKETGGQHDTGELPEDLRLNVFHECLKMHYRAVVASMGAVAVTSALLVYLAITPENRETVLGWWLCFGLVTLARLVSVIRFRRQDVETRLRDARKWYLDALFGGVLSGLAWGAAGFLFYSGSDIEIKFLLAVVIIGLGAGSIVTLAAVKVSSIAFQSGMLLPMALRLLLDPAETSNAVAALVLIFLAILIVFSRRVNSLIVRGLEMSLMRHRAEKTIEYQALYDELTGLPNRRLLGDRLSQSLAHVRRYGGQAALLFLDLDHFKRVNDTLGHSIGDELLKEVADRLLAILRDEDTAARLGGDEFVVLMSHMQGDESQILSAVKRRGEELRQAIEQAMSIRGNEINVTASIGVSLLPAHTDDLEDLLKHADTAMYQAKDDGRNTLRFFASDMQESLEKRMRMEKRIRSALDAEQFELHLQPQHREDQSICGAEFLLRWRDDGAPVAPNEFIPVAEDCGLIYPIGDWVVNEACRAARELRPLIEGRDFSLSLNVSPKQFQHRGFTEGLLAAMSRHQIPAGMLELELTEELLIKDGEAAVEKMRLLRDKGLSFAIDDFGTGYLSMRFLGGLPLSTLKIDSVYIDQLLADPGQESVFRSILAIANSLDLDVIAEGVERSETHDFLSSAGCPRFQGYFYSRPMSLQAFKETLGAERSVGSDPAEPGYGALTDQDLQPAAQAADPGA